MKTPESVTDIKVGGKTPEEIKKGLKCCSKVEGCKNGGCAYYDLGSGSICIPAMAGDALAYIQQLEESLTQVEREREELLKDFKTCVSKPQKACKLCENRGKPLCSECERWDLFKWRGVCPENTKEDK